MRRFSFFLAVLVVFLLGAWGAKGSTIQWSVADGGNGHYYEFVNTKPDGTRFLWPDAKLAAESMTYLGITGHLVTIASAEENNFVFQNVLDPGARTIGAWIGLTDDEAFGGHESFGQPNPRVDGWVWVTGESINFTGWSNGEPNNADGHEDYGLMHAYTGTLAWNDQSDYYTAHIIVEFDAVPEPSTFALLGVGTVCLLVYAGRKRFRSAG